MDEKQDKRPVRQERFFDPTEDMKEDFGLGEEKDDEKVDETQEVKDEPAKGVDIKKLAPIVIAGVIVIIVFIVLLSKTISDKKQVELEEHADELLSTEEVEIFQYTVDEVEALRNAGYTGYEIDDFEFNEMDAESLIKEAEEKRKAIYETEIVPYLDAASDEFKDLKNKTWLCLDNFEIPSDPESWKYEQNNYNVDYEKIASCGMQCFIKFYMPDGSIGFTTVSPERYMTLDDKGNLVLNIRYCVMSNGNRVIVDAYEVNIDQ